jgi:2-keto-4-pentenoate hydratase/2-oxohepta-3-ene-1,7-dioic acid hydratase in catechol pathway
LPKFVRYLSNGPRYGELRGEEIVPLTGEFPNLRPSGEAPIQCGSVQLLAPVVPGKIVAIGPNYHAMLKGGAPPPRPYIWIKPASVLQNPDGEIRMPTTDVPMVCHESELAIVIGRRARHVRVEEGLAYVFGYTCINDVSAGELTDVAQYVTTQHFIDGKIYDTFGPLGPLIVTDIDPHNLRIQCRINGQIRQDHRTSDQIWKPADLVAYASSVMTLNPGDVIATGSPPNPGPMKIGDLVEIEIEGIGVLRNRVVSGEASSTASDHSIS